MAAISTPVAPGPSARNWSGWIALAILFGFIIPTTIVESFKGTDVKSTDPVVQAGNLEAVVGEESPKDKQAAGVQAVITAMAPKHYSDEVSAAVYASASAELHHKLSALDLAPLTNSKIAGRRTMAELYAEPPPSPDRTRVLVASLSSDRYLFKLAKAQALERLGDSSIRRQVSPLLDTQPIKTKVGVANILFGLAFLGGCVVIVGYLGALATGSLKWRGHPLEPESDAVTDRLAIRAAQLFGVFLFVGLLVESIAAEIPGLKNPAGSMATEVSAAGAIIASTALLTFLPIGGRRFRLSDYGLTRQAIVPSLIWGIGGLFAVVPLAAVGMALGLLVEHIAPRPDHPLMHMLEDPHNFWFIAGALFLASVQAPFTEELMFRGTLTPALSGLFRGRRYGVAIAIALSGLIFASIHPQGFTLWLPLASVGIVNGVLCYQTRSVLPGMFMHALFNATIVTVTLVVR